MEKISNQLLRDSGIQPTDEIIAKGLGGANVSFLKFIKELEASGFSFMDWRYYNDGKAWLSKCEYKCLTPRGTEKIKPIFWLSIWEGFFKVSFFFGESIRDELLSLKISLAAKEIINNAYSLGRTTRFLPVIFDITNDMFLRDVYELAQFRKIKVK